VAAGLPDAFRVGRSLKPITSSKELRLLRLFCGSLPLGFGERRRPHQLAPEHPAERCRTFHDGGGKRNHQRQRHNWPHFLRAATSQSDGSGLRIGDVAMLARDRIGQAGNRWRIFLRTEKRGKTSLFTYPRRIEGRSRCSARRRGAERECRYHLWHGTTSERAVKGIAERTLAAVFKTSGCRRRTRTASVIRWRRSFSGAAPALSMWPISLEILRRSSASTTPSGRLPAKPASTY
jgi:hypothetical protein